MFAVTTEFSDDDPLVRDMQMIAAMFPDRDRNEIYAYLEAHHDNANRVQVVAEELLRMQDGGIVGAPDPEMKPIVVEPIQIDLVNGDYEEAAAASSLRDIKDTGRGKNTDGPDSGLQLDADVKMLTDIFPDCDPDYIVQELATRRADPSRVEALSAQMFDRSYPKLKDRQELERKVMMRWRLQTLKLDIPEFLQMFPDPDEQFMDEAKPVSEAYKEHAAIQLGNDFHLLMLDYIRCKLRLHQYHFAPTYFDLNKSNCFFKGE